MAYEVIKSGEKFIDANYQWHPLWLARPVTCEAPALWNKYFTDKSDADAYAAKMNKEAGR
jgi:hypothetical protein